MASKSPPPHGPRSHLCRASIRRRGRSRILNTGAQKQVVICLPQMISIRFGGQRLQTHIGHASRTCTHKRVGDQLSWRSLTRRVMESMTE
jgi:hypothetical protein